MRIVVKFGGTSVGSVERIRKVAQIIKNISKENEVIVIASAMASTTNELINYCNYFYSVNNNIERDTIVASGEQISIGLLALAIAEHRLKSKSILAWQLPILTDNKYCNANILNIKTNKLEDLINSGYIPVIAGFQGVTEDFNLTTLGRGGSDTTAVAIAVALKADACYIYTDVDGIYNNDPHLIDGAKKIDKIGYNIMMEMANSGAKVLHCRSIELAYKNNLDIYVKSTFNNNKGTCVTKEENILENPLINGIVLSNNEVFFKIYGLRSQNDSFELLNNILESGVVLDMISQDYDDELICLKFVVSRDNLDLTTKIVNLLKNKLFYESIEYNSEVSKVSIIGIGIQTHPIILQKMFQIIKSNDINIFLISLSNLKISVIIDENVSQQFVKLLNQEYKAYLND